MCVTVNEKEELYVIPHDKGHSCLGFDVCLGRAQRLAAWLRLQGKRAHAPAKRKGGTMAAYNRYQTLLTRASLICQSEESRCETELTPQLIGHEGQRVEVVDCYGEKRRFYVGKSTGWWPIHLEMARCDSSGGGGVTGAPFRSVRWLRSRGRCE